MRSFYVSGIRLIVGIVGSCLRVFLNSLARETLLDLLRAQATRVACNFPFAMQYELVSDIAEEAELFRRAPLSGPLDRLRPRTAWMWASRHEVHLHEVRR